MDDNKVLDRIKKLLSLANSSNEHESALAAEKANELLLRHNLSMQQVSDSTRTYTDDAATEESARMKNDALQVAVIMTSHFFVRAMISGRWVDSKYLKRIVFIGEKTNLEIAVYCYQYLLRTGREQFEWKKYKKELKETDRKAFFTGYCRGLKDQLNAMRHKVVTGAGLVLIPDPGLAKYMKDRFGKCSAQKVPTEHGEATAHGYQVGKETTIRRGVTASAEQSNKFLNK